MNIFQSLFDSKKVFKQDSTDTLEETSPILPSKHSAKPHPLLRSRKIPESPVVRQAGAGFSSRSENSMIPTLKKKGRSKVYTSGVVFDELVERKNREMKKVATLASNTAGNVHTLIPALVSPSHLPVLSPPTLIPKLDISELNSKWISMMDEAPLENRPKKRNITFNETVVLHSIERIKDLIEEYDRFERDSATERVVEKAKEVIVEVTPPNEDHRKIEDSRKIENNRRVERDRNQDFDITHSKRETIDIISPPQDCTNVDHLDSHLSGRDRIFQEARNRNGKFCGDADQSSLLPGCPTPERTVSPARKSKSNDQHTYQNNKTSIPCSG